MHCVVVVPGAAPDETVFAEDFYYLARYAVGVFYLGGFLGTFVFPEPVVGVVHADVEGYAVAVCALPFGAAHGAPVEGAGALEVFLEFGIFGQFWLPLFSVGRRRRLRW